MANLDRINSILYKEISRIIQFDLNDPSIGFVTVSDLKISPDLKYCKIYVSVFSNKGYEKKNSIDALNKSKGRIKKTLAKNIHIRQIPELEFIQDRSLEVIEKIERLNSND